MPEPPLNSDVSLDVAGSPFDFESRSNSSRNENLAWVVSGVALLLVFLTANFGLVTGSQGPLWDADGYFGPAFTLIADHARAGRIMLWNPWIAAGSPDYAEPELGAVSPVTLTVGLLWGGTSTGFRVYYLLIWFLGPLGMLLLARHLGSPIWGALVVSLGIAFCGFYTGHAQHTCWLYSFSFLPWIVWRMDAALVQHRYAPALQSGALWGLSALGGYPGHAILTLAFIFLWTLGRFAFVNSLESADAAADLPRATRPLRLPFILRSLVFFCLIGLTVLSPAYVAFFVEGHGFGDRVGIRPREEALTSNTTPVAALTSFSSPYITKLAAYNRRVLWTNTDATMIGVYVGALIPIFAVLAIFARPRSHWRWWLLGISVFALACAAGGELPIRGWLYDYVPPTRYFRNAALFRGYAIFCVALLALLALKGLAEKIATPASAIWKRFAGSAVLMTLVAISSYAYIVHRMANKGDLLWWANVQLRAVWLGAVMLALGALIWPRFRRVLPAALVLLAITDAWSTMAVLQGGRLAMISSSGPSWKLWKHLDKTHNSNLVLMDINRTIALPDFAGRPNNKNVPVKVPTFENYETMWNRFEMDAWRDPVLVAMSTGTDRIWFADQVATVTPTDAYYQAFLNRSEALKAPVVIVHPPLEMDKIRGRNLVTGNEKQDLKTILNLPPGESLAIRLRRYTPNHFDFEVSCPRDGWLLVTDRWAHGWSAKVDRQQAEIFGGNFIFRALRVHSGVNEVEFSYRPAGWPGLVICSWASLAAVFLLMPAVTTLRRRTGRALFANKSV